MTNIENVRKWVAALRSGEYKQGRGALSPRGEEGEPTFCCLGVACDISRQGEWEDTSPATYVVDVGDQSDVDLPLAVHEWLGFPWGEPIPAEEGDEDEIAWKPDEKVTYEDKKIALAILNDGNKVSGVGPMPVREHTFEEIADLLEKEFLE